ncbi:unnamed protein product [Adineta steineri]|uniref:F-box domain-containing protein n=1 Tax=Adineta steineri TaxID=433720 RepID=A0A819KN33_9BILA|nr:unnamed protein product [Adineta steineri]
MFHLLPNELFYEVFEYLTTYEILYAFKGLDKRIDVFLSKYKKYDLNFISCPKWKFDFVCQSISSEQFRSLILSDDTPRQIHLFFNLFYIRQFVNLESLTLIEITEQDSNKLLPKLSHLPNLSYLSIQSRDRTIIPSIQSPLVKLPHHLISKISLKHLSIGICSMSQLQELLSYTSALSSLDVQLYADTITVSSNFLSTTVKTEIRQLKIKLIEKSNITFYDIEQLSICMPKLKTFTFIAAKGFRFIHGNQWEQLIRTYLPELKKFHFKIHPNLENINVKHVLATFQTPFWLKENQWIIHCDHFILPNSAHRRVHNVHLYTLPYSDQQFHLCSSTQTETKVSKIDYYTIKDLYFSINSAYSSDFAKHYYFSNLDSLTIRNLHKLIPLDNFINLSQIKHLTIEPHNTILAEEFFSYILEHSTQLQSLELSWQILADITKNFTHQQVCLLLSKQIKSLNLLNTMPNKDKSMESLNKIFATNLEKLSVCVTSMDEILILLNEMLKLDSMKIEYNSSEISMNNEELSLWLMKNVPRFKNFTSHTRLISEKNKCLCLWIGH